VGAITENITLWQWILVVGSSALLFLLSPWSNSKESFFKANKNGNAPSWILLTGSLVISWVFAKSITNASDLGYKYGAVGGLAYAGYYLSFIVAGVTIYYLRIKGGFKSIHHFLFTRFGKGALRLFSIVIAFRLFNEIWSNTMVIGGYFGEVGSSSYYTSILVFTALTLAYCLKGGLNSSIFSDAIQMGLFAILLVVILYIFLGRTHVTATEMINAGEFSWANGLNLLLVALLQSFSYPFHDPVMTDRGFISSPKTTIRSFILAGIIGAICIFLFSFLGVYGKLSGAGVELNTATQKNVFSLHALGTVFGPVLLLLINFIMIVSAASTLDSSFSSFSKLAVEDLKLGNTVKFGRITMIIVAIAGTVPIFFNPAILSATTVSGTMVIGLTPVFLFWKIKAPPISFYLSLSVGILFGVLLGLKLIPNWLIFTDGPYNDLLWSNIFGVALCILLYFAPILIVKTKNEKNI